LSQHWTACLTQNRFHFCPWVKNTLNLPAPIFALPCQERADEGRQREARWIWLSPLLLGPAPHPPPFSSSGLSSGFASLLSWVGFPASCAHRRFRIFVQNQVTPNRRGHPSFLVNRAWRPNLPKRGTFPGQFSPDGKPKTTQEQSRSSFKGRLAQKIQWTLTSGGGIAPTKNKNTPH